MIKHFLTGLLFSHSMICLSQNFQFDSTQLANRFVQALKNPAKADSILPKQIPDTHTLQDVYYYHASRYFFAIGKLDSALSYAESGLELSRKDRKFQKASKFYNLKGSAMAMQGNYKAGISELLKSVKISETLEDELSAALVKNNIANIFFSLRDYESAYKYASASYNTLKQERDSINLAAVTGIAAISAIKLDKIEEGRELTSEALDLSEKLQNPVGLIIGNHAQAELFMLEEKQQLAIESYQKSLDLSNKYRQSHYVLLNKIGLLNAYLDVGEYGLAIEYGEQALSESIQRENENTLYAIRKKLGLAYAGVKNYEKAFTNILAAHDIFIANADRENRSIINEMLIKYETEQKERILAEQAIDLLKNQQEISQRNNWILFLSLLFLLLLVIGFFIYRLTQQNVKRLKVMQEQRVLNAAEEGEERERERISHELHDGIASALTGVKMHLEILAENKETDELTKIIEQLSETHEDVRRISHNLLPPKFDNQKLEDLLREYCQENSSKALQIQFSGKLKKDMSRANKQFIYRAVQELVNNVHKHAFAQNCTVQLNQQNNQMIVSVEDDGIGFEKMDLEKGQGVSSLKRRMEDLGGELTIETQAQKGTLVILELPLK